MTMTPGGIEYRYSTNRGSAPRLDDGKLSGRAAPFNTTTMIGKKPWGFREKIAPGAFQKSINDGDVTLLDNHDSAKPIARQSAGTLKLSETKGGLDWDAVPANTTYANDVIENARAGNYGGCSFGFEVVRDSWHYNDDEDVDERTLHEVKLHEISVCTFPAYNEGTSVTARDQVDAALEARDRFYDIEYMTWIDRGIADEDIRANKAPYGNVTYADPGYQKDGKKRYPIDTKAHVKAAWSYINKAHNGGAYSPKQLASIKSKIKSAAKKFGIKISSDKPSKGKNSAQLDLTARGQEETVTTSRGKIVDEITDIAFDESRGADATTLLAEIRAVLLGDLRKRAKKNDERSVTAGSAPTGNNAVGTGAQNDMDSDDPICPECNGTGLDNDGVSRCPGGCSGTGRLAGPGDGEDCGTTGASNGVDQNQGNDKSIDVYVAAGPGQVGAPATSMGGKDAKDTAPKSSAHGLGLNPGANSAGQPANTGTGVGDGHNPAIGTGGPQLDQNSKKVSGETRDGQPDASTDQDGDEDVARRMRAVARAAQMRRETADATAGK